AGRRYRPAAAPPPPPSPSSPARTARLATRQSSSRTASAPARTPSRAQRPPRQPDHLRPDRDPPLVQRLDRVLVPLSDLSHHVLARNPAVVQYQLARRRRPQPELVLLLPHLEPRKLALDQDRRHALVSRLGVGVREQQEEARLRRV